jgi:Protoglobin
MSNINIPELTEYAKKFSNFTPEREALLIEFSPAIKGRLGGVTDDFYRTLQNIKKAEPYLEGRVDSLKETHHLWLESVFSGPYDDTYTQKMYHVGDVHVKVNLPVEFMAGGMTLISDALIPVVSEICAEDVEACTALQCAVNAVLGYSLMIMQESYQASSLASELEKFLKISGISKTLFDNLAKAYQG